MKQVVKKRINKIKEFIYATHEQYSNQQTISYINTWLDSSRKLSDFGRLCCCLLRYSIKIETLVSRDLHKHQSLFDAFF